MAEVWINMFENADKSGKKPHYKLYFTKDGVEYEAALWPSRNGKGFSGKIQPKQQRDQQSAPAQPPQRSHFLDE